MSNVYTTQNDLLLNNLMAFYKNEEYLDKMLKIITGESKISLRIVDWFATNFAKKYYTTIFDDDKRFKVYVDYKLKLKAYSKRRFDPFCRWERISIPLLSMNVIPVKNVVGVSKTSNITETKKTRKCSVF